MNWTLKASRLMVRTDGATLTRAVADGLWFLRVPYRNLGYCRIEADTMHDAIELAELRAPGVQA